MSSVIFSLLSPAVLSLDFWISVVLLVGIAGIFSLGIQLNAGSSGLLNVGHVGFMAIGAYTMAILVVDLGVNLWLAIVAGIGVAVLTSLLIGLPSLRLRHDYFAIATIAFAEVVRLFAQNARGLTGGNQGKSGYDGAWRAIAEPMSAFFADLGWTDSHLLPLAIVTWVIYLLMLAGVSYAVRTPWGRVLRAVREDEDAASALGKNVLSYKLQSLAIAAALAAVAGVIFALDIRFLVPEEFLPDFTFLAYAAVILGGLGSYAGVFVGTITIWVLLEVTRFLDIPISSDRIAAIRFILIGLVLIFLSMRKPEGLLGERREMVLRHD